MGAIRDFLDSVGRTKTSYTGSLIPGPPPADTASAADKAAFDESVRKYQLDRRAYEQYNTELNNRIRAFNPYADSQYRIASTAPAPATTTPGQTPAPPATVSVPTAPAPTAPTQLRAPTYGAISQFSNLTPQQQGELYLQQRNIGYTDADIRKATAAQVGTPNESTWTGYLQTAYPDYARTVEQQYGTLFNRTGFGSGAQQIDNPGFNYWVNQLSSGAVAPQDLASIMRSAAATTPVTTPVTTPGTTAPTSDINALYQQYFNRQADPRGLQYWQQSGLTGDALRNAIIAGAQGPDLDYYNNVYNRPTPVTTPTPTPVTTPGTTAPSSDINALYQQYFNRQAEPEGLQYWQQSGLTGDALRNAVIAGAQGPDLDYYNSVYNRPNDYGHSAARGGYISKYAEGGRVRTHYQTGGMADEGNLDDVDAFYRDPRNFTRPQSNFPEADPTAIGERRISTRPINNQPSEIRVDVTAPAPEPAPEPRVAAPRSPLEDMLNRYMGVTGEASRELASARQRSQAESEAFYNLIRQQAERGESPASRSEMYFRLASAFGAPTRTGQMGETLSNVGQQMSEYTRGRRTEEGERRNLLLRAQEARMGAAREDLATTRGLAAQEAQERRALVAKLLEISARNPSERERKIADIMRTNPEVDYATASNIVNGIVVIRNNPVTGEQEQVNVLTNEVAPLRRAAAPAAPAAGGAAGEPAAPGAAPSADAGRQPPAQPPRTLWEMAPSVTGIAPAVQETVQGVTGQVGINAATEGLVRDRQTFATVQNDLIRALSVNPRFPVAEMQRIEREIAIAPGVFTDPRSLRERMVSVNTYLRDRLRNEDRAATDTSLPSDDRRAALSAANNIRNFLAQLGVPEGADTARLPSSSRSTQRNRPQAPSVGSVVDGYRFLGGDPSDRSNWSRE